MSRPERNRADWQIGHPPRTRGPGTWRIGSLCLLLAMTGCRLPQTAPPVLADEAVAAEREVQREAFLRADEARRTHFQAIAFPLLREAAALYPSKDARPAIGIAILSTDDLAPPYDEAARRVFGLADLPQIRAIAPGSPAEGAGFRVGDFITSVGGESLSETAEPVIDVLRRRLSPNEPLVIGIRRGEQHDTLAVTPALLAPYRLRLVYDAEINARATGGTVEVNLGMLRFCQNDAELAFVIAHELAHNALRHQRDAVVNYLLGTAADVALLALHIPSANVLGITALSKPSSAFEAEADYVALYLLARAGYDLDALRGFWRRMALLGPERRGSKVTLWTHPEPAARQVRLERAIDEIQERLAAGHPLVPRRKP